MKSENVVTFTSDQLTAEAIRLINQENLNKALDNNDVAYLNAINQIDKVKEFVGSPNHILGSQLTKHGEIAERLEVGIRNAKAAFDSKAFPAFIDAPLVPRTAPHDYIIDGEYVQSKFINGVNNNLDHVIEHLHKYPDFTKNGYYHIPKEHLQTIQKVLNGEETGLSVHSENVIKDKICLLENETSKTFSEIIKPSVSNYSEVQQGTINKTLRNHEANFKRDYEQRVSEINNSNHPTLDGLKQSGLVGMAVGGGLSFINILYIKHKEGKNISDFSIDDWKDLGIASGKGSIVGGISAVSIYGLTNYADLSAPFAGAVVSASKGIGSLLIDYKKGIIDEKALYDQGTIICTESAIVGIATFCGQTFIPVPILGSLIGSVSGQLLANLMNEDKNGLKDKLREYNEFYEQRIMHVCFSEYNKIVNRLNNINSIMESAFDLTNNRRLIDGSILLARAYNVGEANIIHNFDELDMFMNQ